MSEIRLPDTVITIKMPENQGNNLPKTSTKYELFKAGQFRSHYDPHARGIFMPQPPLNTAKRQEFWAMRYKVRINGKWHGGAKYTIFTREQVAAMIFNLGERCE